MNFETGVISASSPSIGGACAPAGPNKPATTRAASLTAISRRASAGGGPAPRRPAARTAVNRLIDRPLSGKDPSLCFLFPPAPATPAPGGAPAPRRPAARTAVNRLIDRPLSGKHPCLGSLYRPAPAIVSRRARLLIQSRLEPTLERPASLDVVQRAPETRAEPG